MNLLSDIKTRFQFGSQVEYLNYQGTALPMVYGPQFTTMPGSKQVSIDASFTGYVAEIHRRHPVVSAAVAKRAYLVSQIYFQWQADFDGAFPQLSDSDDLEVWDRPNPAQTRQSLLWQAETHASYAGMAYFYRNPAGQISLLRPDWTNVLLGSNQGPETPADQLDAVVLGYIYKPGNRQEHSVILSTDEVKAWIPEAHPIRAWTGESWVTSALMEIGTDLQALDHLSKFYENAATPQLVFTAKDGKTPEQIAEMQRAVAQKHTGTDNAYNNLFIGGGWSVQAVGSLLSQLNYDTNGASHESRIVVRSQVPAAVLGIREGLKGSALNAGNFESVRRLWADTWFVPHALSLAAALEPWFTPPQEEAFLTFDPKRISFMQADRKDEAAIRAQDAQTMNQLVQAGFEPESIVEAIGAGDWSELTHTGLFSVQLQPPGTEDPAEASQDDSADPEGADDSDPMPMAPRVAVPDITFNLYNDLDVPERSVTISPAEVNVDATTTVAEGAVRVETTTEPADVFVTVEGANVVVPESKRTVREVQRDEHGQIVRVVDAPEDE